MLRGVLIAGLLFLCLTSYGCSRDGAVAEGGGFVLLPEDLRFEVYKLGPSYDYTDSFADRQKLVDHLAARFFLSEEALKRGHGEEDLAAETKPAEAQAVGEAYHAWKIQKSVRVPRAESKQTYDQLDRKLHLKQMVFLVYPRAAEALARLRAGASFDDIAASFEGQPDVSVRDHGWKVWRDFDRNLAPDLFHLSVGQTTGIIMGKMGYGIYYLAEDQVWGADPKLIYLRSKRYVRALREAELIDREKQELIGLYDVRYSPLGPWVALRSFEIAFGGSIPPDSLLGFELLSYRGGSITVGYLFNYYWTLPPESQPYVGDLHAIEEFALDTVLFDLEKAAGYDMNLARTRDVIWNVEKAEQDFLIGKIEESFRSQVTLAADDPMIYYNEHRSELMTPRAYRLRRILLDSQESAREAMKELKSGKDFAELAQEISRDGYTAPKGGDLGYVAASMLRQYDSVLVALKPGQISSPFATSEGFEIIKVEELIEPSQLSFEEARESIEGDLLESKINGVLAAWVDAKKTEVGYTLDEDLLKKIDLPEPAWRKSVAKESPTETEG
ncbi:MAG: peptidylprolyl isomerase [Candidatus Eisenbacteria bacterium]